jgi:hypothetical protein
MAAHGSDLQAYLRYYNRECPIEEHALRITAERVLPDFAL